jgi:hypothetical protein
MLIGILAAAAFVIACSILFILFVVPPGWALGPGQFHKGKTGLGVLFILAFSAGAYFIYGHMSVRRPPRDKALGSKKVSMRQNFFILQSKISK